MAQSRGTLTSETHDGHYPGNGRGLSNFENAETSIKGVNTDRGRFISRPSLGQQIDLVEFLQGI